MLLPILLLHGVSLFHANNNIGVVCLTINLFITYFVSLSLNVTLNASLVNIHGVDLQNDQQTVAKLNCRGRNVCVAWDSHCVLLLL